MNIGLDIDDVLLNFVGGMIKFHNERYGTKLRKKDFTSYSFNEVFGGTMEEAIIKVDGYVGSDHYINMAPLPGAVKAVNFLYSKKSKLHLITSRSIRREKITRRQLDNSFGQKFDSLNFSKNHYSGWGEKTKAEFCSELEIDYHLEDSIDYAKQIASQTPKTKVILMDSPWNQTSENLGSRIVRVKSWNQIIPNLGKYL